MRIAEYLAQAPEPTLRLVPDRPAERVWDVVVLVALAGVAFAVPWLAQRGWVLPGVADQDRRRTVQRTVAGVVVGSIAVTLLSRVFGVSLGALWLWANALFGAPLTILLVAVGAYRFGQLNPRPTSAAHEVQERQ
jgi:hypothetical protein